MRIPRIYQATNLEVGQNQTLNEKASHYLINVLRVRLNADVVVFNGQGGEYSATISQIKKRSVDITIQAFHDINNESPIDIQLGQAISRGEKMDFTLQKSVELGVNSITPLFTERCGVKLSNDRIEKRMQHWQQVIISACEQSGRNYIPSLEWPSHLHDWLSVSRDSLNIVLNPHQGQPLKKISNTSNHVTLLIGPEGGLTEVEIEQALAQHFTSIQLGPRILRTETAAMATLAAIQTLWGDL